VFFKMLSAMVAADALNRHQREQQHRRWRDEQRFRAQRLHRTVAIPYDEHLATMLDCGTYTLDALGRNTRVAIKQLGLAVTDQLV
jgi:hypothetical protein